MDDNNIVFKCPRLPHSTSRFFKAKTIGLEARVDAFLKASMELSDKQRRKVLDQTVVQDAIRAIVGVARRVRGRDDD